MYNIVSLKGKSDRFVLHVSPTLVIPAKRTTHYAEVGLQVVFLRRYVQTRMRVGVSADTRNGAGGVGDVHIRTMLL